MRAEFVKAEPKQVWVAFDGTRFDKCNECERYEARFVRNIPHVIKSQEALFDGSPFCLYVFFKIQSEDQARNFKMWCDSKWYDGDETNIDFRRFIGKTVVVDCRNESDDELEGISDIYCIETVEENVGKYAATIFSVAAVLGEYM